MFDKGREVRPLAVSSRGLGRGTLKAQTRVRIPLPLWTGSSATRQLGCSAGSPFGPFVYRLGRHPFTVQRGVRFPYGLLWGEWALGVKQVGSSSEGTERKRFRYGTRYSDARGAVAQFG